MEPTQIIIWLIICCLCLIVFMMFSKPIKIALKVLMNSAIGCFVLFLTNFLLTPLSIQIGINIYTALIIGILGLPGFISLYIIQAIL